MNIKGSKCSINGKKYELEIFNILKYCKLNKKPFNTLSEDELGGCSRKNDIECNMNSTNDIAIEFKKINSPDWMQCSLKYNGTDKKWIGSSKNIIPILSKNIFENLLTPITLFNSQIPPFMYKKLSYNDWINIKDNTSDYNDIYIDCPNDTIKQLYIHKGCSYIQISNKGLYYLDKDICNFSVPQFICDQQLRIRIKVHTTMNNKGFCDLSVIAACQPKNIKLLPNSNYSLDDITKLPSNLIYNIVPNNKIINTIFDEMINEIINEIKFKLNIYNTIKPINHNSQKQNLTKMSKRDLLDICDKHNLTKYKSKNKSELIHIIEKIDNINTIANTNINNISPLRYPGGKSRACKIIENIILQYFDINNVNNIISPFFGGGSFEFYLQNKYGLKLIVNDKFIPLYNFWKQIKINKNLL
jgi:hypothetical protein